jgi:hypothetical protein
VCVLFYGYKIHRIIFSFLINNCGHDYEMEEDCEIYNFELCNKVYFMCEKILLMYIHRIISMCEIITVESSVNIVVSV